MLEKFYLKIRKNSKTTFVTVNRNNTNYAFSIPFYSKTTFVTVNRLNFINLCNVCHNSKTTFVTVNLLGDGFISDNEVVFKNNFCYC